MATTNLTNLKANAFTNVVSTIATTTNVIPSGTPKITTISYPGDDTAANTGGGQTVVLTGTGFNAGASVLINGTYAGVVAVANSTSMSFTTPAQSAGTYTLYVINTDGGTAISIPGISYSGTPNWSTAAGTLGTSYETAAINNTLTATGDAPISYSLYSGTLPPGSSLNSSTGLLSGTSQGVASSTTYNFTIRATDAQNQDTDRAFSITISPDVVTWSSPADNSTTTAYEYANIANVTMSATSAAGKSITYTANTLPTGLSITGNTISGTPTVVANTNTRLTANSANTFKTATKDIKFVVNPDVVTWSSPADGTSTALAQGVAMSNVTLSATSAAGRSITYTANALPTGVTINGANVSGTPTVIGTTNSLITATAATTNRTATRNFTWVVSVGNDTYWKNTTLLLNGETTSNSFISDASTNNLGLIINGDTKPILFNPYQGDGYYGTYFNGSSYIDVTGTPVPQTGQFTIEAWVYTTASATQIMSSQYAASDSNRFHFSIDSNTGYKLSFAHGTASTVWGSTVVPLNQWNHVAVTRDASNTLRIFLNGVLDGSQSSYTSSLYQSGTRIGYFNNSGSVYFNGYISNMRVISGTAQYTSSFTPSTSPLTAISGTSFLALQSNRFVDKSSNAYVMTNTGVQISPAIPFTANSSYSTYGSTYFDGSGDYLNAGSNAALNLSGDFTVEMWVYGNTADWNSGDAAGYTCLVDTRNQSNATENSRLFLGIQNSISAPYFYNAETNTQTSSSITVKVGAWNHIAYSRSGSTIKIFVNGIQGASFTDSTAFSASRWVIGTGASQGGGSNSRAGIQGYISDHRVVKGTALYTTAFTPPTSPLTAVANTSLLTLQYNGGATNYGIIDNSNFNNSITRAGNTSQGTFSPYSQTGWSNYFNGGSYITTATSSEFTASGNGFTIEAWVYYVTISGYTFVVASTTGQNNYNPYWFIGSTPAANWRISWGDATAVDTGVAIATNTWNHVALVMGSNGSGTFYVNGVSRATTTGITLNAAATGVAIADGGASLAGSYLWPGYISNVRYVKNSSVYTGAFTPSTTPLTPISGTSLLTCQSNRFIDNSLNNIALTITSVPQVQAFSPFGSISEATPKSYSISSVNGSNYVDVSSSSNVAFGSGDYTIEWYTYFTVDPTYSPYMWDWRSAGGAGTQYCYFGSATYILTNYGPVTIPTVLNTWRHWAMTRVGTTWKLFIDGTQVQTGTDNATYTSSGTYRFGLRYTAESASITGLISNLRFVKGQALYTGSFTPSTTPLTTTTVGSTGSGAAGSLTGTVVVLTLNSPTIVDNSATPTTITSSSVIPNRNNPFGYTAQSVTSYTPSLHGGSAYFDGTGDYLSVPSLGSLGSNNFTMEAWIYPTGTSSDTIFFYINGNTNSYAAIRFGWQYNSGNPQLYLLTSLTGSTWAGSTALISTSSVPVRTWTHVAVVRSGNNLYVYQNGILITTNSSISGSLYAGTVNWIGSGYTQPSVVADFAGHISDVRFINGTALYTSNFLPPTQTLTNYSTTYPSQLLLNFTNGGVVDQHSSNVLETVGNVQLSTAVKKYNNSSVYFDGTGDYLQRITPSIPMIQWWKGSYTIEYWIYANAFTQGGNTGGDPVIVGNMSPTGTGNQWSFGPISNGTVKFYYYNGSIQAFATTSTLSTGQWYHLAFVNNAGALTIYINGVSSATSTISGTPSSDTATPFVIGSTNGASFNGYIDDLRITPGVARYTANFTAPTSAFVTK